MREKGRRQGEGGRGTKDCLWLEREETDMAYRKTVAYKGKMINPMLGRGI